MKPTMLVVEKMNGVEFVMVHPCCSRRMLPVLSGLPSSYSRGGSRHRRAKQAGKSCGKDFSFREVSLEPQRLCEL